MERKALLLHQRSLLCAILLDDSPRRGPTTAVCRERSRHGEFHHLFPTLRNSREKFFEYTRMWPETFDKLLNLVTPMLMPRQVKDNCILPQEKLVVTLRYLATGSSFHSLHFSFRVGISTVALIVRDTCQAIVSVLQANVKLPETAEEWLHVSEEFERRWSFPNVLGCIDGKHIKIKKPANSGSAFFNYKGSFSTVLLGICDANYRFLYYDLGNYGHHHDSHILDNSSFGRRLRDHSLKFPEDRSLPSRSNLIPYFFLGDGGFPLTERLMKPFAGINEASKATFNYRLSHARRVIENAFGILAGRWRILLKNIETEVDFADDIVAAAIHLHNFLCDENTPYRHLSDDSSEEMESGTVRPRNSNNSSRRAQEVRTELIEYFLNEGAVTWQEERIMSF